MKDSGKRMNETYDSMNYVLEIAYNGTAYHGWQVQQNAHSVQEELNNALKILLQEEITTLGSGRTDTGVHAEQQFVQFHSSKITTNEAANTFDAADFLLRINAILPKDIFGKCIYKVRDGFSVRHDAVKRSYEYRISRQKNPFLQNLCCFYFQRALDVGLMNEAAHVLLQHTDFQSFSKYRTNVNHFECTLYEARWEEKDGLLIFHISANRFLRGMVRAIVGTLLEVGLKKINCSDLEQIVMQKDRKAAKHAVPPEGLFLTKIVYRENDLQLLA